MPIFNIQMPKSAPGVDSNVLNPRNTWNDKNAYDQMAQKLAKMFKDNFKRYAVNEEGKKIEKAGPLL